MVIFRRKDDDEDKLLYRKLGEQLEIRARGQRCQLHGRSSDGSRCSCSRSCCGECSCSANRSGSTLMTTVSLLHVVGGCSRVLLLFLYFALVLSVRATAGVGIAGAAEAACAAACGFDMISGCFERDLKNILWLNVFTVSSRLAAVVPRRHCCPSAIAQHVSHPTTQPQQLLCVMSIAR